MKLFARLCGLLLFTLGSGLTAANQETPSLVERLGYPADAKLLIINADDYGMNFATCAATESALEAGIVTSATIMTPCPWFNQAASWAQRHPQANLGVHLTLTSEWHNYKWGPVLGQAALPSLCDEGGYFYRRVEEVHKHANLTEVEREIRAQLDKALAAGVDVTHIDSHMGTLQMNKAYHQVYLQVARDYALPCRIADSMYMKALGFGEVLQEAKALGVLHPEHLIWGEPKKVSENEAFWKKKLARVRPGRVTEVYIHCGQVNEEMLATTLSAYQRAADTAFFSTPATRALLEELGITLISYRELRHLQRHGTPLPR